MVSGLTQTIAGWIFGQTAPDNAEFISQVVPEYMFLGQAPYQAVVTMRNNGQTPWGRFTYRLSSLTGGTWGTTQASPPNDVYPTQEVSFRFSISVPNAEGFYDFQWQMRNGNGQLFGSPSDNVSIHVIPQGPPPPTNLHVTAISNREVDLAWTRNSDNEDGFYLERRIGELGAWLPLDNVGPGVTRYLDHQNIQPSTTYYYRVRAFWLGGGHSAFSNEPSAAVYSGTPSADFNTILPTERVGDNAMLRIPGAAGVGADGAATYSIPLWVPPGRAGIQPSLSVNYSSNAGNGLLGVGWTLSGFSQIHRCKKTWAQDPTDGPRDIQFTTADRFCLDGQRLVLVSGVYGGDNAEYRTEVDTFVKVISHSPDPEGPLYFEVFTKDGRVRTYGAPQGDTDSHSTFGGYRWSVTPSGDPQHPYLTDLSQHVRFSWALSGVKDRSGNFLSIYYTVTGDVQTGYEQFPIGIRYTGFRITIGSRYVQLYYETRPDPRLGFTSGFKTRSTVRLSSVRSSGPDWQGRTMYLHEYDFTYEPTPSAATGRSLLHEVKECDEAGTCARSTVFDWTRNDNQFDLMPTPVSVSQDIIARPWATGDLDGDGRDDIVWVANPATYSEYKYALSTGNDFNMGPAIDFPRVSNACAYPGKPRVVDLNNDGYADLVAQDCNGGQGVDRIFFWNWSAQRFSGGGTFTGLPTAFVYPAYFADLNGDGLPDWVEPSRPCEGLFELCHYYRLNTPFGFSPTDFRRVEPPVDYDQFDVSGNLNHSGQQALIADVAEAITLNASGDSEVVNTTIGAFDLFNSKVMLDVNGDGLVDAFVPNTGQVSFNTGNGFAEPEVWQIIPPVPLYSDARGFAFDFDKSGRQSAVIIARDQHQYLLTPTSIGTFTVTQLPDSPLGEQGVWPLEINGDGLGDLMFKMGAGVDRRYWLDIRHGPKPDLLTRVTDGFGRWDSFDYAPLGSDPSLYRRANSPPAYPQHAVPLTTWVVSLHQFDDGIGGTRGMQYSYQDGRVDLRGRGFIGFASQTVTDLQTRAAVTTEYDNATTAPGTTLYLYAKVPRRIVSTVSDGPSTWTSEQRFQYTVGQGSHNQPFLYASNVHTDRSELVPPSSQFVLISSSTMLQTRDAYGNATGAETQADVIVGGVRTGQVHRTAISNGPIDNSEANWLIGLVRHSEVTSTTPDGRSQTRTTEFDYFSATGLLQLVRREPASISLHPELYLETEYHRDDYGLAYLVQERGSGQTRSQAVTFQEPEHLFPSSSTNSAGHVTRFAFHDGYGLLAATDDANGVRTQYRYDGFRRARKVVRPDNSDITISYGSDGALLKVSRAVNGGGLSAITYDRLGRAVAGTARGFDGSLVYSENAFDNLGRLVQYSNPHFANETPARNTLQHDILGRSTRETRPDNTYQQHEYHGLEATTWDFKQNESHVMLDEFGRVSKASHFTPAPRREIATTFQYGPFSELEVVIDALGNQLLSQYDLLGRRKVLTDPDSGTTTTDYDAFSQVVQETAADGSSKIASYDNLGRAQLVSSSIDGDTTFVWDTSSIGRLASSTSPDGIITNHTYDALERRQQSTWNIENNLYSFDYSYDTFGRLGEVAYPVTLGLPRLRIGYGYNVANYLQTISKVGDGLVYWQATQRNAFGELTSQSFGNGLVTQREYDANLGLLRRIETTTGQGQRIQRLLYGYDNNNNVASRLDDMTGVNELFANDFLDRLSRWDVFPPSAPNASQTFSYDDIGNLSSRTTTLGSGENIAYGYGSGAGPHALTSADYGDHVDTYQYDLKGNQWSGPGRIVQYTAFNLPRTITGGTQLSFKYDASQQRVIKREPNGEQTLYLGSLYEKRTSQQGNVTHVFYVQAGRNPVAQVERVEQNGVTVSESTRFLHLDKLRTVDTVTDEAGAVVEQRKYEPFGDRRNPQNPLERLPPPLSTVRHGFTFQEHDDEFGLINMRGRIYDPRAAHFLTVDPVVGNPLFGQSYNPYAYALNNPTTLIDPLGFDAGDDEGDDQAPLPPPSIEGQYADFFTVSVVDLSVPDADSTDTVNATGTSRRPSVIGVSYNPYEDPSFTNVQVTPPRSRQWATGKRAAGADQLGYSSTAVDDQQGNHQLADVGPALGLLGYAGEVAPAGAGATVGTGATGGLSSLVPLLGPAVLFVGLAAGALVAAQSGKVPPVQLPLPGMEYGVSALDDASVVGDPSNPTRGVPAEKMPAPEPSPGGAGALSGGGVPTLPPFTGKTIGVFRTETGDVTLQSGWPGPALEMPKGSSGFDIVTRTHAEGHAVALMWQGGLANGLLFINNPNGVCGTCAKLLPRMLAPGSTLTVVLPDGSTTTFTGNPEPEP